MFLITEQEERMMSYSNVDDVFEGYKIKSALPFKFFLTLLTAWKHTKNQE